MNLETCDQHLMKSLFAAEWDPTVDVSVNILSLIICSHLDEIHAPKHERL